MRLVEGGEAETIAAPEPRAKATRDGGGHSAASPGERQRARTLLRETGVGCDVAATHSDTAMPAWQAARFPFAVTPLASTSCALAVPALSKNDAIEFIRLGEPRLDLGSSSSDEGHKARAFYARKRPCRSRRQPRRWAS